MSYADETLLKAMKTKHCQGREFRREIDKCKTKAQIDSTVKRFQQLSGASEKFLRGMAWSTSLHRIS